MIKNCLEEWRKRRAAKATSTAKKQPEVEVQAQQSDVGSPETSDFSRSQSRDPAEYGRLPRHQYSTDTNNSRRNSSPIDSPLRPVLVSPRTTAAARTDVFGNPPYVPYGPENIHPSLVNGGTQFLPDIYVASNALSFNPGNTIAIMPTSPYDSFGALLNSGDMGPSIHQTTTSQIRVSAGARPDNMTHNTRQDEDEQIANYTYNPSERIERMFGISPPWRDR